ncbi:MAG: hypothetical protein AAF938_06765 [Myxococcota bacterium]
MMRVAGACLGLLALLSCGEGDDFSRPRVAIASVVGPTPLTYGSVVEIRGAFSAAGVSEADLRLRVSVPGASTFFAVQTLEPLSFAVSTDFVDANAGQSLRAIVQLEGAIRSDAVEVDWRVELPPDPELREAPSGAVHYADPLIVQGDGFPTATEGGLSLCVEGSFDAGEGGSPIERGRPIEHCEPAALVDGTSRNRALLTVSPAFGSPAGVPGITTGRAYVQVERPGGAIVVTPRVPIELRFLPPELLATSEGAPLEWFVRFEGAGFLAGPDDGSTASTVVELVGEFTSDEGAARPIEETLFPEVLSGNAMRLALSAEAERSRLRSALFGADRGVFVGTARVRVLSAADDVASDALPVRLEVQGVRQAVLLQFAPQFSTSLARFGLSAGESVIREAIAARLASIYDAYRVDVFLEAPVAVGENGLTVIEIGGPDPSGLGLFGIDNSAGKDAGNVRLFDVIGGANAELQADGFVGFGGVFVESYLWWSAAPGLDEERPVGAPRPDPLFDTIFDPVRQQPATLAEVRGEGDAARTAAVALALESFASLAGETAAHELGHALGLTEPFGDPLIVHNPGDGDGCMMDSGPNRPLGERAGLNGFSETRFCRDSELYLRAILGD